MLIEQNSDLPTIPTSLLLEKKINLFLRLLDNDILSFVKYDQSNNDLISIFKLIRKLKDSFGNNN
ncbi:hydroxyacylglutathione hydrolase C-terminal domain-containing protein [Vibrio cholerae]|uniref:hydroxyacylglutathione hydrolase C-terminal domain-containing protein n=1 Tax=Vibrio cholerae TaxID=666 RepID=UPI0021CFE150|nr:hydroxyacylglutathione hydrolase C-terminal domain-containing protein [Vibrio cholerae]